MQFGAQLHQKSSQIENNCDTCCEQRNEDRPPPLYSLIYNNIDQP